MHIFHITATEKSKQWFDDHRLDMPAMGSALSLLMSEIHPITQVRVTKITCQISFNQDSSKYLFKTNKIFICDEPYYRSDNSLAKKQRVIFDHFLHEFRHWMHSRVYRLGVREINYTEEDVLNNTNAYYRNRLEIDARQFVRQNLSKFTKYYKAFAKINQ